MIFVLKISGFVLLCLLALLSVTALLVLFLRTRIDFRGKNGDIEVRVGIGALRMQIYPLKPKQDIQKAKKPQKAEKPQPSRQRMDFRGLEIGDTLTFILDLLAQMKEKLILEVVLLNAVFATGDAAQTGMLLGGASAMAGMIVPFLEQNFNMEQLQMKFGADFDEKKTQWAAVVVFAVRPVSVLRVLLQNRKALHMLYKQIVKKEEATENE